MQLFDAHCHLQDEKLAPALDAVLSRASDVSVTRMVCCGSSESDWPDVQKLSEKHPQIVPSFGLHPWYTKERSGQWLSTLGELLKNTAAGIGECGLDHAIEPRNDQEQESVFIDQLQLAHELKRPVSIHCRRAWDALLKVLETVKPLPAGFVIHSYSGGAELVPKLASFGAYFSFSGTITRSGNKRGHQSVLAVPEDRLLIETDAPDLPPVIHGVVPEEPNEPSNLVYVLRKVAELRGQAEDRIADITFNNACKIFCVSP